MSDPPGWLGYPCGRVVNRVLVLRTVVVSLCVPRGLVIHCREHVVVPAVVAVIGVHRVSLLGDGYDTASAVVPAVSLLVKLSDDSSVGPYEGLEVGSVRVVVS